MEYFNEPKQLFDVYKSLFDHHHDPCYALDKHGKFKLFNRRALVVTGYEENDIRGIEFTTIVPDYQMLDVMQSFKDVLDGNSVTLEISIAHKDGHLLDFHVTALPIYDHKEVVGVVGVAKEVTERNLLHRELMKQNRILEMIARGSNFVDILDEINRYIEDESSGGKCSILLVEDDKLVAASAPNLPEGYYHSIEGVVVGPNEGSCGTAAYYGKPIWVADIEQDDKWEKMKEKALQFGLRSCYSSPVFDMRGRVIATFALYYDHPTPPTKEDIDLIKKATDLTSLTIQHYRAKERINFMAFHDSLTQLPNRRFFDQKVEEKIQQHEPIALLFLDLDRFKVVNDSLGHSVGDRLLQSVANRLKECLSEEDIFSRQGGDEFTILLNRADVKKAVTLSREIIRKMSLPFIIGTHEIFVSTSIGFSLYPLDGSSVEELVRKADVAMYQAKNEGRNKFRRYVKKLDIVNQERMDIENELRKALVKREFSLLYQPILDVKTNKITGVEALVRWDNRRLGRVPPNVFIPVAEETGLILSIGEWVMMEACEQVKKWELFGVKNLQLAVNLSIRQFYQPDLLPITQSILEQTKFNPANLTMEITETMTMEVDAATEVLQKLKMLGLTISIDDFGTGYSSLTYLKKLPIDILKIDRSFTNDLLISKSDEQIVNTIIIMAHNLGLEVVAEGVEVQEQLSFLEEQGCEKIQGYYISKPLSPEEFIDFYLTFNEK